MHDLSGPVGKARDFLFHESLKATIRLDVCHPHLTKEVMMFAMVDNWLIAFWDLKKNNYKCPSDNIHGRHMSMIDCSEIVD